KYLHQTQTVYRHLHLRHPYHPCRHHRNRPSLHRRHRRNHSRHHYIRHYRKGSYFFFVLVKENTIKKDTQKLDIIREYIPHTAHKQRENRKSKEGLKKKTRNNK